MPNPRPDEPDDDVEAAAERLKQARSRVFSTASDASRQLGVPQPTYLAHENGSRRMRREIAQHYAEQFGVSFNWLWLGQGIMVVGEPKASPAAAPSRQALQYSEDNPLLSYFKVQMAYGGNVVALDSSRQAFSLPPTTHSRGYVPELMAGADLTAASGNESADQANAVPLRYIKIADQLLILRNFLWLPRNLSGFPFLFAFEVGRNSIFNPGDRCLVDAFMDAAAANHAIKKGGRFALLTKDGIMPIFLQPATAERTSSLDDLVGFSSDRDYGGRMRLWLNWHFEPDIYEWNELQKRREQGRFPVLGRIVGALSLFTDLDDRRMAQQLPAD